jgi:hypothetical protein
MKKIITLLLLLGSMYTVTAQVPFPSANTVWAQREGQGESAPLFSITGMKADDVTIGAYTYHKLYRSRHDMVLDDSEYIGGLREDTARRVYYYDPASSAERLIYDFSLTTGDTIFASSGGGATGVVYGTDTVTIGGVDRKRITFRHLSSSAAWVDGAWIEGIGNSSLGGLLGSPMAQPTCDCAYNIVCMTVSGVEKYHNTSYPTLDCSNIIAASGVANELPVAVGVSVVPNPVRGNAALQISGKHSYTSVTLTDVTGRKVLTSPIAANGTVPLQVGALAAGIYIYILQADNGERLSGRFVVE